MNLPRHRQVSVVFLPGKRSSARPGGTCILPPLLAGAQHHPLDLSLDLDLGRLGLGGLVGRDCRLLGGASSGRVFLIVSTTSALLPRHNTTTAPDERSRTVTPSSKVAVQCCALLFATGTVPARASRSCANPHCCLIVRGDNGHNARHDHTIAPDFALNPANTTHQRTAHI